MFEIELKLKMTGAWNWPYSDYLKFIELDAEYHDTCRRVREYERRLALRALHFWDRWGGGVNSGYDRIFETLGQIYNLFFQKQQPT